MSSTIPTPPPAAGAGAVVDPNEPPSKSALKKAEKLLQLQAKKALKSPVPTVVQGGGVKKKEKVIEKVVVVEQDFIEVPEGYKKSESCLFRVGFRERMRADDIFCCGWIGYSNDMVSFFIRLNRLFSLVVVSLIFDGIVTS